MGDRGPHDCPNLRARLPAPAAPRGRVGAGPLGRDPGLGRQRAHLDAVGVARAACPPGLALADPGLAASGRGRGDGRCAAGRRGDPMSSSSPNPAWLPRLRCRLLPEDKIPLRATGRFDVQSRERLFADLPAYWRTYASREHAVLAIQHPTRFLLLGHSRDEDAGMWYAFIPPAAIAEVTPGALRYGRQVSPGLRVVYRRQPPVPEGKRPRQGGRCGDLSGVRG